MLYQSLPAQLGLTYFLSEIFVRFARRSDQHAQHSDAGSLRWLWISIALGIGGAVAAQTYFPAGFFALSPRTATALVAVFGLGLALRWWAILVLGRFFTVDVAIAADHELVVRGPYRFVRHPSYSGMMLAFAALAATFQNWLSFVFVLVPISLGLAYRIRVEEHALVQGLGDAYRRYQKTTKRLIPGMY